MRAIAHWLLSRVPGILWSKGADPGGALCGKGNAWVLRGAFSLTILALAVRSRAGVVEEWNAAMVRVFQAEAISPCLGSRHMAILHAAIHDAVNVCMPRDTLYRPVPAGERLSTELAAQLNDPALGQVAGAGAGYEVLRKLAPARQAEFDKLLSKQLAAWPPDELRNAALGVGRQVAERLFAERAGDGSSTTIPYVPKSAPGQWRRTEPGLRPPEMPHWALMRPFSLDTPSQFRAPPAPAPDSGAFRVLLEEITRLGGKESSERTAEQTLIARFWSDFSYTSTPPGHWNEILRDLSLREPLSLHESARAFYLLNIAMADAGLAVWDSKYHYNTWRPVTAVHHSGTKDWQALLVTPPHPDYLSGHSGFSGAAAVILNKVFPDRPPGWSFTVRSDTLNEVTRTFSSFDECAKEISMSRVYGGIHFRHSCEEGVRLGHKVGDHVMRTQGSLQAHPQTASENPHTPPSCR